MASVLVMGGAGYIGTDLTELLLANGHRVTCLDRGFFGMDAVAEFLPNPHYRFVRDDVRMVGPSHFDAIDVVIDLAGISNDPACDLNPRLTEEINEEACIRAACFAKRAGARRFIFSSSCSVYGKGTNAGLTEKSELHPVSLYAKCKIAAERAVLELAAPDFCVTILRNATVYGYSRRMRYDLVVNLMTAKAFHDKTIFVLGGGQQWRPNVHVRDVSRAFVAAMEAPAGDMSGQVFNVGSNDQTFRVIDIAHIVGDALGGIRIELVEDDPDKRSYNVSFDKIRRVLGFTPQHTIAEAVADLRRRLTHGTVRSFADPRTKTLDYYTWLLHAKETLDDVCLNGRLF